ncbi:AAA family ATPase [Cupriavidus sp. WGtm5]|nr:MULTISPECIES: adenylate/guanylate cyclase domain-containing protein [Cupriavidus]MCO4887899.1 AAA family ATPase [Cupriavidus sp. WGtm5]
MRCASCGHENSAHAKFCEECGNRISQACPQCGAESSSAAKFCSACGLPLPEPVARPVAPVSHVAIAAPVLYTPPHLAERILAEWAAMEARGASAGERKTITALFADMAGSTALIQDLDPEEARGLIDPVVCLMMDAVHHYEGYVAKLLGDGILALFGAPIAHEDHPMRAIYGALHMQEAMRRHGDRVRMEQGVPLQIRVGVHTGEVVVRSIRRDNLHTDYDPVGNTIHIASRMESVAMPSSILVSESTYKLTKGYFEFKDLGTTNVKGLREPLAVYEVLGLGPLRTRLQVAAHRGLAKFVGRQAELTRLQDAYILTKVGRGQIVGVLGEAGVGKSRLFHEFKLCSQQGCMVLETFSVSHGKAFPYLPLVNLLRNYFQITMQDDARQSREKVAGRLMILDRTLAEHLPYLLYLLGFSEPGSGLSTMDSAIRRQRTFEAIARLLVRESQNQPLMVLFEDLQWLDSETEAFLSILIEYVPEARILLLINYRPEYVHDWSGKRYYTQLHLEPLGQPEAQGLLTGLLGNHTSLAPLTSLILSKTEGNPFFMEEVVQTLVEENVLLGQSGGYRIEKAPLDLHIPTTVQGVLAARIDRLPVAQKELLQTLAVIGKEFPLSLIRRVMALPEEELRALLGNLQQGDFIFECPALPEVEYSFKHALTQEVAGNSLLTGQRSMLHERTAQAIEALYPGRQKDYCSELAHHYSKSGNVPKAIEYLHLAAQQALERSAHLEAIRHLSTALEILKSTPDSQERAREELILLLTLGPAWMAARGQASAEVESTYKRALVLCEQGGETPELFSAQLGLWSFYQIHGQYGTALNLAERLLKLAQRSKRSEHLAEAHRTAAASMLRLGRFGEARTHMEQVLSLHRPDAYVRDFLLGYGRLPAIHALSALGWILWFLGFPDQSRQRNEEALALAKKCSEPFSLALSLLFAAELHQFRRETQQVREYADAAIALSSEQGFPLYLAWGAILRGWALAVEGNPVEGIARIQEGIVDSKATGAALGQSRLLGLLAEVYGLSGNPEAGLATLTEAQALAESKQERYAQSMLHHLKGELLLQSTSHGALAKDQEAEDCLRKAVAIAHEQGASSLELRASLSLARLWQREGKTDDARRMLAGIHGVFTEGFDTADWQEVKALLESLT